MNVKAMRNKGFLKSGHLPTLFSSFLYFDISFMIWVLLGASATYVVQDFELSAAQQGLMVGLPILGGAILRLPMGILADRYGGRLIALIGMTITAVPLLWGWLFAHYVAELYALGLLLGVAGASFAVALPLASRWYPPQYQGLAMGIAGAGNSGTLFATLFAPRLAEHFGWNAVFGFALLPLFITFLLFFFLAKDSPNRPQPKALKEYLTVLKYGDSWWFCFFYSLTFGGFVGFASYLGLFFVEQYGVSNIRAGEFVTLVVAAGSFCRPIGGFLADRFGGTRLLLLLFALASISLAVVGLLPPLVWAVCLLFITLMCLGMGNGALFQVIPQRFPKEIGVVTGLVGAAGGMGGFFLPNILGTFKDWTSSYSYGFWWFGLTIFIAIFVLYVLQSRWRKRWVTESDVHV